MLLNRKQAAVDGGAGASTTSSSTAKCLIPVKRTTTFLPRSNAGLSSSTKMNSICNSTLFRPGAKILVHRAPILSGLSVSKGSISGTTVPIGFQRPMLKRRAYGKQADQALAASSLGPKRRLDGMAKLLARAGKGLTYKLPSNGNGAKDGKKTSSDTEESDEEEEERAEEKPYEPLEVWKSPHQGGAAKGLPPQAVQEMRPDEYGVESLVTVLKPAPASLYATQSVFVPLPLARILRPHQREGVQFMYECVMGLKDFEGNGCILADDMGLGKTLQSVALIYTMLKTGILANGAPTAKRIIIVCPCSLVKNWDNEFVKWLGPGVVKTLALAEGDRKTIEKNIDCFARMKLFNILIASYECIRTHVKILTKHKDCCDLLVCDEAHRLKNSENQTSRALNSIPVKRRVLLTGTPMQNDLTEFYAMVDFTNHGILGTPEEFRRRMMGPILRGREPDATEAQKRKMGELQNDLSTIVEEFILRRVNTLNAEHLPPKLVQVVCCNLTDIQQQMYSHLINSKDMQHVMDGKQVNCLASIQLLMKLSNHPSLVVEEEKSGAKMGGNMKRSSANKQIKYSDDPEKESTAAPGADGIAKFLPYSGGGGRNAPVHPEWSGKMYVLYRLMKEMRRPGNGGDKIVIISNYTQTLDLIGRMCRENGWGFCRLDGSVSMKKRQSMVDDFNDPGSSLIAFLLSSKAGGCGLNLIGGNRLVLFDPDWNPAVDKQAAARCWRDGQKKRCFTYRFLATGTVEEKIFQRQLSKEGLQSVVDDKEQVNALSTKDLKNLFKLRSGTPSDTHDKLRCERCKIIQDTAELEAQKALPRKLAACRALLDEMASREDAHFFAQPLDATLHGRTKEEYEQVVKQPMDFETIRKRLDQVAGSASAYTAVSAFSKDVNRIFTNVAKLWNEGEPIFEASKLIQADWLTKWTDLVPVLMTLKADEGAEDDGKPTPTCDPVDADEALLQSCATVGNERGEDYQEQIGMPDEENMRHWSHHYSTDTVDDPIFRAAMRGTDAVSFVFGLEVTWSNLKARAEAEEEAEAMKAFGCEGGAALEAIEEEEDGAGEPLAEEGKTEFKPKKEKDAASSKESDGEDDDDDGADLKSFIAEDDKSVQSDGEASFVGDRMDLDKENVADPNSNGTAAKKAKGDFSLDAGGQMDALHQDDTDPGHEKVAPSKLAKQVASHDSSQSMSSPESRGAGTPLAHATIDDSSPDSTITVEAEVLMETSPEVNRSTTTSATVEVATPVAVAIVDNGSWSCLTCTLVNKKSLRKCQACGTKKPAMGTSTNSRKKRSFDEAHE